MKVKVTIPYIDYDENKGELILNAECKTDCLATVGGKFQCRELSSMTVDCTQSEDIDSDRDACIGLVKIYEALHSIRKDCDAQERVWADLPDSREYGYIQGRSSVINEIMDVIDSVL